MISWLKFGRHETPASSSSNDACDWTDDYSDKHVGLGQHDQVNTIDTKLQHKKRDKLLRCEHTVQPNLLYGVFVTLRAT